MNLLIVVDMQKDFIDGSLGTAEAQAIVPAVKERIVEAMGDRWQVIFTKDTHSIDYLKTQEGRNLPVMHCLRGSDGWQFPAELQDLSVGSSIFEKAASAAWSWLSMSARSIPMPSRSSASAPISVCLPMWRCSRPTARKCP